MCVLGNRYYEDLETREIDVSLPMLKQDVTRQTITWNRSDKFTFYLLRRICSISRDESHNNSEGVSI